MTEAEKLRDRIIALGYNVVLLTLPYSRTRFQFFSTRDLFLNNPAVEVVIIESLKAEEWNKNHDGLERVSITYRHHHYWDNADLLGGLYAMMSFFRPLKLDKGKVVESCLDDFEECISWYCKPPKKGTHVHRESNTSGVPDNP